MVLAEKEAIRSLPFAYLITEFKYKIKTKCLSPSNRHLGSRLRICDLNLILFRPTNVPAVPAYAAYASGFWPETNGPGPWASNETWPSDWWLLAIIYHRSLQAIVWLLSMQSRKSADTAVPVRKTIQFVKNGGKKLTFLVITLFLLLNVNLIYINDIF